MRNDHEMWTDCVTEDDAVQKVTLQSTSGNKPIVLTYSLVDRCDRGVVRQARAGMRTRCMTRTTRTQTSG